MAFRRTRFAATFAAGVLLAGLLLLAAPAFAAAPTITSFTPTSGKLGQVVTITGTNFAAPATVSFGGTTATNVTVVSATKINAGVPYSAGSGKITVTTPGGTATSTAAFTVTPGVLVGGAVGPPGAPHTIYFAGFGAYEAVDVYLDTTDLALGSAAANGAGNLTLTIPASAAPGAHTITAVGRHSGYSAQTPFTVRTDWPQYGYTPTHHATNGDETRINGGNVDSLDEAWRVSLPGFTTLYPTPAIVGGLVYEGFTDGTVRAFDEATGAQKWMFRTGEYLVSSPAVLAGTVYVGSGDGYVYALNAVTGAQRWRFLTGGFVESSPAVVGSSVYIGSDDGYIYSLNATTGSQNWRVNLGTYVFASPAVAYGKVYVPSGSSAVLYALSATDGSTVWSRGLPDSVAASAVVANGRVYEADLSGNVQAFDAATGTFKWTYAVGVPVRSGVAVAYGRVYVNSDDGPLALDAAAGTEDWSDPLPEGRGSVTVANRVVYATSQNVTYALEPAYGAVITTFTDGSAYGFPVVADGTLTIGSYTTGSLVHYTLPPSPATAAARLNPALLRPDRRLHRQD